MSEKRGVPNNDNERTPLMDALQLAEEIEAVADLLVCFAEGYPTPRVRSVAKALQRSAHQLALGLGELLKQGE